jgi:ribosomal protein S18 acetylase RimI-like enzyme
MVHHLAVAPAARKSGLGTELAKTGLRALYRLPDAARRVYVTVLSTNEGALRFWTKFGFTPQTAEGNIHLFTLDLGAQSWLNT